MRATNHARRPARLLLAVLVAGCSAQRGKAVPSTVTILDPDFEAIFNPSWDMPAKFSLFLPLVTWDYHGAVAPLLAKSWEHSADQRVWTYHLRTDVKWHDGVPVTAHDVAWSIETLARPDVNLFSGLDSARALDDSTVIVYEKQPYYGLDDWTVYYPKHLLDTLDASRFFQWDFWKHPVGDGPYRFVRYVPKTVWEMEANPEYFLGKPRVDHLLVKFGGGNPVLELESGSVDAVQYLSRTDIPRIRDDPRFRVYWGLYANVGMLEGIFWNERDPLFRDRRVRRALTMALNRKELHRTLNLPDSVPVFDVMFSGRQYWKHQIRAPVPYDTAAARRLLAEAGWRDTDGDGILDRDGRPFRFQLITGTTGSLATSAWGVAAVYIQAAYKAIGVDMQITPLESGILSRWRQGRFQALLYRMFQPDPVGQLRDMGYADSTVLAALDRATHDLDTVRADRELAALAPAFARDMPMTLIAPHIQFSAARSNIHGLRSPFRAHPLEDAGFMWKDPRE